MTALLGFGVMPSADTVSAIHDVTRSVSPVAINADTSVDSSNGGPTTSCSTWATSSAVNASTMEWCT